MKHLRYFTLLALLMVPLWSQAQQMTTWGTDFWVAFVSNWKDNDVDTYMISISGPRSCTATVSNPNTGWTQTVSVSAGQVATVTVPEAQCWQAGSCVVSTKGLHVSATDTVCVTSFSHAGSPSSCDAIRILPLQALGSDYIVSNYPMYSDRSDNFQEFCILAVQDSETVRINFTDGTSTGIQPGDTVIVQLNAGEVYRVRGVMTHGDFTGTRITELGC